MGEPGGLPVYGVAQSRTRLKRLSSSNCSSNIILNNERLNACPKNENQTGMSALTGPAQHCAGGSYQCNQARIKQ